MPLGRDCLHENTGMAEDGSGVLYCWDCSEEFVSATNLSKLENELATLRAKAEALDRLEALTVDGWRLLCVEWTNGARLFRLDRMGDPVVTGPSLVEAINALPRDSEEK